MRRALVFAIVVAFAGYMWSLSPLMILMVGVVAVLLVLLFLQHCVVMALRSICIELTEVKYNYEAGLDKSEDAPEEKERWLQ